MLGNRRSRAGLLLLLCAPGVFAADVRPQRSWKRQWIVSALVLSAASFADAATSAGRYEQNPLLRGSDGLFSARRALAVKAGAAGGVLLFQALLGRRHPQAYKTGAITNFALSGAYAASAERNTSVPK